MGKLRFSKILNYMSRTTKPGLEPRNLMPKPTRLPPSGPLSSVASLREPWQDTWPVAMATSEQGEDRQCFCSVGTLPLRAVSQSGLTMSGWFRAGSPPLDVPRSLARTLGLSLRALAALGAASLISVASDQAGLCGEESRHFHWECRGQTGFCSYQALCQQNSPR